MSLIHYTAVCHSYSGAWLDISWSLCCYTVSQMINLKAYTCWREAIIYMLGKLCCDLSAVLRHLRNWLVLRTWSQHTALC